MSGYVQCMPCCAMLRRFSNAHKQHQIGARSCDSVRAGCHCDYRRYDTMLVGVAYLVKSVDRKPSADPPLLTVNVYAPWVCTASVEMVV